MPVFTIEAPDGSKVKVEADTPELAMQGAQEAFAAKTKGDPKEGADVTVGSVARSLFRGLPFIGSYRDELAAKGRSLVGQDYEEGLAKERGRDDAFHEAHPYLDTGLQIGGGIAGTMLAAPALGAAGTGGAIGAVGRTALGLGAKSLPGAVARGAIAGGLQGAAAGSGDADGGFVDRAMGGLQGGAIGLAAGAAVPAAFEGARRVGASVIDKIAGNGDALSGLSGAARRYVGQLASPSSVNQWEQDLARLGPDGMLADVSPEWQMVARGAAARPGSRDTVVNAIEGRDAVKNQRLAADLDRTLGQAEVPTFVEEGLAANREALDPVYRRVLANASPVDTSGLAQRLERIATTERGRAQRAASEVRQMLDDVQTPGQLDSNPATLLNTRQAIDGLLGTEVDTNAARVLRDARREVDAELTRNVPGIKDVDALHQELARQSTALTRGGQVLDSGKTAPRPAELAREVQQGAQPAGTLVGPSASPIRMRQGTRAEIDRVAGQNANDPIALQRLVKGEGDWNRDKLRTIFGQGRADDALGAIDREAQFRDTRNRVTRGSDTGATRAFQEGLDRAESPMFGGLSAGSGGDLTMFGVALKTAKNIGGILTNELGAARANRFATELARVSIADGVTRDQFVTAMRNAGVRQQTIGKALDYATRTGLIVSREAPSLAIGSPEQ